MKLFSRSLPTRLCCLGLILLCPFVAHAQLVRKTVGYEGGTRSWLEHVPASYNGSGAVPLVLALHGAFSNADAFASISGWSAVADAKGFIVVFPNGGVGNGTSLAWHDWIFDGSKPDDIGFLSTVIATVSASYRIDPARVYMTGFSDGGDMTSFFAAARSASLAGIAMWAGDWSTGDGQSDSQLKPTVPIPAWLWRGAQDDSPPGAVPLATQDQQQIAFWVRLARDNPAPRVATLGTATTSTYSGGQAEVRFTSVSDLSHGVQPNMAARTWTEFFARFSRAGSAIHDASIVVLPLPAVKVRVAKPKVSVASGAKGIFLVSRDGGLPGDLTVGYALSGTAAGGVDYKMLPGAATLAAGTVSKKVKVRLKDVDGAEGMKTVRLTLLPGESYTLENPATAKLKIVEDR